MAPTRLPNYGIQLKMTHSTHKKNELRKTNGGNRVCNESARLMIKSLIDLRLLQPNNSALPTAISQLLVHLALNLSGPMENVRQEIARHFTPAGPNLQSRIKCNRRCFRTATHPAPRSHIQCQRISVAACRTQSFLLKVSVLTVAAAELAHSSTGSSPERCCSFHYVVNNAFFYLFIFLRNTLSLLMGLMGFFYFLTRILQGAVNVGEFNALKMPVNMRKTF